MASIAVLQASTAVWPIGQRAVLVAPFALRAPGEQATVSPWIARPQPLTAARILPSIVANDVYLSPIYTPLGEDFVCPVARLLVVGPLLRLWLVEALGALVTTAWLPKQPTFYNGENSLDFS